MNTRFIMLSIAILLCIGLITGVARPQTVHAQTIQQLQAQIQALLDQVEQLQIRLAQLQGQSAAAGSGQGGFSVDGCYPFTPTLNIGSRGEDVTALQQYLRQTGHLLVGATGYFGPLTHDALIEWQADNGVSPATGIFNEASQERYNQLCIQ